MMRPPFFSFGFGVLALAMLTAAAFFLGPLIHRPTAGFLFSKVRYLASAWASGSPFPWTGRDAASAFGAENGMEKNQMAAIIFRPPAIPYDQLIIDQGERDGVQKGDVVLTDGNRLVGSISEVFWDSSRVLLPTSFNSMIDVIFEDSSTAVPATGNGGGEFRVRLPRDFPVRLGERVFATGAKHYELGVVESIENESTSAIKEARVRQSFNLRALLFVHVAKE